MLIWQARAEAAIRHTKSFLGDAQRADAMDGLPQSEQRWLHREEQAFGGRDLVQAGRRAVLRRATELRFFSAIQFRWASPPLSIAQQNNRALSFGRRFRGALRRHSRHGQPRHFPQRRPDLSSSSRRRVPVSAFSSLGVFQKYHKPCKYPLQPLDRWSRILNFLCSFCWSIFSAAKIALKHAFQHPAIQN